jgi:hypothetical protein
MQCFMVTKPAAKRETEASDTIRAHRPAERIVSVVAVVADKKVTEVGAVFDRAAPKPRTFRASA